MESQVGGNAPKKTTRAKLPPPPPSIQPLRPDFTNHKKKKDKNDHEVVEGRKGLLSKKAEL